MASNDDDTPEVEAFDEGPTDVADPRLDLFEAEGDLLPEIIIEHPTEKHDICPNCTREPEIKGPCDPPTLTAMQKAMDMAIIRDEPIKCFRAIPTPSGGWWYWCPYLEGADRLRIFVRETIRVKPLE